MGNIPYYRGFSVLVSQNDSLTPIPTFVSPTLMNPDPFRSFTTPQQKDPNGFIAFPKIPIFPRCIKEIYRCQEGVGNSFSQSA